MAFAWLFWGLGAALALATADALLKRSFTHLSPYGMTLVRLGYAVPLLSLGWLWTPVPDLGRTFYLTVAAALPLEVAASLLYMAALRRAPLSQAAPLMAFTPLFLILTGWLVLGEAPNLWGILGIVAIAAGSYLVNDAERQEGWWAPLTALWRQPGLRSMLLAAALYAFTSALGKKAVLASSPTFFGLFYPTVFVGIMLSGYPLSSRPGKQLVEQPFWGLLVGACMAASILCHYYGIQQAPAAYLIAVKRTSLLFSVLYGGLWLGEGYLARRSLGAASMVLGVMLLTLMG